MMGEKEISYGNDDTITLQYAALMNRFLKKYILLLIMLAMTAVTTDAQDVQNKAAKTNSLHSETEWDKTFSQSDKVRHEKVTFRK